MKAYVFTLDGDVTHVFLDRKKAREFWVYEISCYGYTNPDAEQIRDALTSFRIAENSGSAAEYNDDDYRLHVQEVEQ